MIPYPFHVALLLGLCYAFYQLLLQRETFFRLHRWVLLGGICLAFSLPLLKVPADWSLWRSVPQQVEIKVKAVTTPTKSSAVVPEEITLPAIGLCENKEPLVAKQDEQLLSLTGPVPESVVKSESTAGWLLSALDRLWISLKVDPLTLLFYVYLSGLILFAVNFLLQLLVLLYKIKTLPRLKDGNYFLVDLSGEEAPFSFMNYIFINPARYDWEVYSRILQHEKVHVDQGHSLDMMLAEIVVALQWFNPFAWLYRRAIRDNLEFLTDQMVLAAGQDKQQYQWSLLQVAVPQRALRLVSSYNQSVLKKRIIMMNSKKSSIHASWKYMALIVLFAFSVISLNAVRPDIMRTSQTLSDEAGLFQYTELAFNESSPIGVKPPAQQTKREQSEILESTSTPRAEMVTFYNDSEHLQPLSDPHEGEWKANSKNGQVCLELKADHRWTMKECLDPTEFTPPMNQPGKRFTLKREAGSFVFEGNFGGQEGSGTYQFQVAADFKAYLSQQGFSDLEPELFVHLTLANIDKTYIEFLQANDLEVDSEDLGALAVHRIDQQTLQNSMLVFQSIGYRDMDIEDFIAMHIHEVTPEYVKELQAAGVTDLEWEEVVQAKIHDVSPAYIKSMEAAGLGNMDMEELVGFAIHEVDAEYIKNFRAMGFRDFEAEDIIAAKIHDVSPAYIKSMEAAGLGNMDMEELVGFAIHDVDAEYIKSYKAMGFRNFEAEDIIAAKIHDVSPEYIKSLQAAGLGDMDMEELVGFAIHDVDAEYIKSYKAMGFRDFDAEDIVAAKIHDVSPEYIKSLQAAGLGDLDMEELVGFAIHDVDAEYIKSYKAMGFRDFDAEEIVAAKIHDVSPEYIKSLQAAGLGDMDMEELVGFAIHDVDAEYIKSYKAMGFRDFDAEEIVAAKIHNVSPEYIQALKAAGLEEMDMEEITAFKIHNVQPDYIQSLRQVGLKNLDEEEIIQAKIHGLTPAFIKEILDLGFEDADIEELIALRIHNVTPEFIREKMEEGMKSEDLEDYIEMKIRKRE